MVIIRNTKAECIMKFLPKTLFSGNMSPVAADMNTFVDYIIKKHRFKVQVFTIVGGVSNQEIAVTSF